MWNYNEIGAKPVKSAKLDMYGPQPFHFSRRGIFTASMALNLLVKTSVLIMIVNMHWACKGKILKDLLFCCSTSCNSYKAHTLMVFILKYSEFFVTLVGFFV